MAERSGENALGEGSGPIHHDVALTIDGDDVIAIIEDAGLDRARQCALQIGGVAEACSIIMARMNDQSRLLNAEKFAAHHRDQRSEERRVGRAWKSRVEG